MNYLEAENITKDAGLYASPDFYRVMLTDKIALALHDSPQRILMDVVNHGSEEAHKVLAWACEQGFVNEIEDGGFKYLSLEIDGGAHDRYFMSHCAMQIAYPDLYREFFGELVFNPTDERMRALVELCISCHTNKLHPSDYYGEHVITEDKPAKGAKGAKAPKQSTGHREWVEACQQYNTDLATAWQAYIDQCAAKKQSEQVGSVWLNEKLDALRAEMTAASKQYHAAIAAQAAKADELRKAHSRLKAIGKPKREDYN